MERRPGSLGAQIDQLARLTGAHPGFVEKVREMFADKGVELDTDASPFRDMLLDTFRREAEIRDNTEQARRSLDSMRNSIDAARDPHLEQLDRLQEIRDRLTRTSENLRRSLDVLRGVTATGCSGSFDGGPVDGGSETRSDIQSVDVGPGTFQPR